MSRFRLIGSIAAVVSALLLSNACRRDTHVEEARRRLAEIRAHDLAWFLALPVCSLPPIGDTAGWRPTHARGVSIPAGFAIDSTGSRGFMHGGWVWRDQDRSYTQAFGHWGFSSFQHDTVSHQCRVPVGPHTVLFTVRDSADRYDASAWVVDTMATFYTILHQATGPRRERLFLLRVLQTRPLASQ
jgi:hypothetical protein